MNARNNRIETQFRRILQTEEMLAEADSIHPGTRMEFSKGALLTHIPGLGTVRTSYSRFCELERIHGGDKALELMIDAQFEALLSGQEVH